MGRQRDEHRDDTSRIAGLFAARISAARGELKGRMEALGLHADAGWRIHEEIVNVGSGMAYKLRVVHRVEPTPDDLVVVVALD